MAAFKAATRELIKFSSKYCLIGSYGFTEVYINDTVRTNFLYEMMVYVLTVSCFTTLSPCSDPFSIAHERKVKVLSLTIAFSVKFKRNITYLTFLI